MIIIMIRPTLTQPWPTTLVLDTHQLHVTAMQRCRPPRCPLPQRVELVHGCRPVLPCPALGSSGCAARAGGTLGRSQAASLHWWKGSGCSSHSSPRQRPTAGCPSLPACCGLLWRCWSESARGGRVRTRGSRCGAATRAGVPQPEGAQGTEEVSPSMLGVLHCGSASWAAAGAGGRQLGLEEQGHK
jgi:hypothetical protein